MDDVITGLRRRWAVVPAAVVPFAVAALLFAVRAHVPNTSAALLLVLVVTGFAAVGDRPLGVLGAVSAAVSFDLLLTEPYGRLSIASATDVQTTVLLLLVGIAVTEIAHQGLRHRAAAARREGYLAGIAEAASDASRGTASPSATVSAIAGEIKGLLELADCRFDYRTTPGHPRLQADGQVTWPRHTWDADRQGLPPEPATEIPVSRGGEFMGRFLLTPGPQTHPNRIERQVAVALASQAALAGHAPAMPGS